MSLKKKLNRLKPHLSRDGDGQPSKEVKEESKSSSVQTQFSEIPFIKEWEKEKVKPFFFDDSYCLVREVAYPLNYKHGKYRFSDFIHAVAAWNASSYNHPLSSNGFNPDQLFFFDTETTGLGGGTGNVIFLLGHARVKGDQIILRQHILPNPGAEVPLYQSFLEEVDYSTLVTYNGKSFDWPQVKTRHTLIRDHVPKLPSFGHFDLYHAARRLWKHKLDRMKLSIVEKDVLEFERIDDIPGFLAPMIYFDFVESKSPEGMIGVLRHNEHDILSLITLYTHLSFQLLRIDEAQTVKEKYEVGRWYSTLGESLIAKDAFAEIATGDDGDAITAKHALAFEHKRHKEWSKAATLWKEVIKGDSASIVFEACVELAKIYEHREKNHTEALKSCEKAHTLLNHNRQSFKNFSKLNDEINKRITRLKRKAEVAV